MKKVNPSPCKLDESKRWGLNIKKKTLHIRCSNPVFEWEGSVHGPEIHSIPEIHFGIRKEPGIMIISSLVQAYSFSIKGRAKYHLWFNSRLQSLILWHEYLPYSLFFCQAQQGWAALLWEHEFDGWVAWTLEEMCCLFLFVSSFMPSASGTAHTPMAELKSLLVNLINFWGTPMCFFQVNL